MTEVIRPMLATAGEVPAGPRWSYEFKWDGIRALAFCTPGGVRLVSRNDNDITGSYPELQAIGGRQAVLDGEIVAMDKGRPSFGHLQQRMHARSPSADLLRRVPVMYYVFDLLVLGDRQLLDEPLSRRRELLDGLEFHDDREPVRVSPCFVDVAGHSLLEIAREHGLEGVVAKDVDSRYEPGRRSRAWIKTALVNTQEVVICGWRPGKGRREGTIGSLLLGAHGPDGELRFIGHVGTGFTDLSLRELFASLAPLARADSPYDTPVPREHARDAHWVEPVLVGEVEYRTFTGDRTSGERRLRHASWRGLRQDKTPGHVELPTQVS